LGRGEGPVAQPLRGLYGAFELAVGDLVDLADGGPRQDVVELVEEHRLPGGFELFGRVLAAVEGGEREQGLGLEQAVLSFAVELLYPRLGGEGAAV
jgi:hypothetical protein